MPALSKNAEVARPAVAVISTASYEAVEEVDRSLEEMIFQAVTDALSAAGKTIEEIDGVILSGNDEIDGRVISCMPSAGPAGGVTRDTTMIASSADQALVYGYLRLKAGQGSTAVVLGWAKPSESVDADRAELMAAEPFLLRQVGMNHTIAAALQASRWSAGQPGHSDVASPLSRADLPSRGDSVHAVVIAVEGAFEPRTELAWIVDAGWATLGYELGARDVENLDSLQAATAQIESRSAAAGPAHWDVLELAADSEAVVNVARDTLRLRADTAVNPSGALAERPTSPHVSGLARMVAAVEAIRHRRPSASATGLAAGIGFHGFASQGATVMVFGDRWDGAVA